MPVAFIQLGDGQEASEEELLAWCGDNIAAYKSPRLVCIIEQMPLTMTLKVMKRELRSRLEKEAASKATDTLAPVKEE